ncbi:apolipoprotein N-acyltransferase [Ketobacter sp.]|uniref:apolipoprotein N-acyltransferase n=1 Tax=Ketobacter sp. TaxID=2083498 RepID=UPI0025BCE84F|nr:apolipoprotein N-acyltransferase [Ketobacter sp.]
MVAGILLALPYLHADLYLLSWVAFVPWLWVCRQQSLWQRYGLGLAFGLGCYVTATYWVVDFLMLFKQYGGLRAVLWSALFWLYSAHLPALLAVALGWFEQRQGLSNQALSNQAVSNALRCELMVFPLLVVLLYAHFPMLFPSQLGESQSRFLLALQGVDRFGVYGLDAIIALVNMLLLRALLMGRSGYRAASNWLGLMVVLAWFGYGALALPHWQQQVALWPRLAVGLVQPNEPPSVVPPPPYAGYSRAYPPAMEMSGRLVAAGAELVIWPESAYKGYFDEPAVATAFRSEVQALGIHLMLQDIERSADVQFNTLTLVNAAGVERGRYRKMKRVAFGEYVPLVSDVPWLRQRVEEFFGAFLNEIAAGSQRVQFQMGQLTLVPLICYETLFPQFVADSLAAVDTPAVLVAVSSNAWFGATRQPFQHVGSAVLRAVENRVSMLHVVNNGPSTAVTPDGRVLLQTDFRQAGGYRVDLPYESRTADSSGASSAGHDAVGRPVWHPRWFLVCTYGLAGLCLLLALVRRPCVHRGPV